MDDREWNREKMPKTAELLAEARELLAELSPIKLVYAREGNYEVGACYEPVEHGEIKYGQHLEVKFVAVRTRWIGGRAKKLIT